MDTARFPFLPALINSAAQASGLPPQLVAADIKAESNFNPRAVSKSGAQGYMQLMPDTAKDLGVTNAFDPTQNINAGTRYLRSLIDHYRGNVAMALVAYNEGMGRLDSGVILPESRAYANSILGMLSGR